jgi:hypothetical protein
MVFPSVLSQSANRALLLSHGQFQLYIQTYELRLVNSTKVIKLRGGHCVSFSKVDSTRHAGEHNPDMFQLAAILCHS